jgi:hypothetical protein
MTSFLHQTTSQRQRRRNRPALAAGTIGENPLIKPCNRRGTPAGRMWPERSLHPAPEAAELLKAGILDGAARRKPAHKPSSRRR